MKIENFDWYPASVIAEPLFHDRYRGRGRAEGESANFPTVRESRSRDCEKFIYRIKIHNLDRRDAVSVVWSYGSFHPQTGRLVSSRKFVSDRRIKAGKRKTLYAASCTPPATVLDVELLLLDKARPYVEKAAVVSARFRAEPVTEVTRVP